MNISYEQIDQIIEDQAFVENVMFLADQPDGAGEVRSFNVKVLDSGLAVSEAQLSYPETDAAPDLPQDELCIGALALQKEYLDDGGLFMVVHSHLPVKDTEPVHPRPSATDIDTFQSMDAHLPGMVQGIVKTPRFDGTKLEPPIQIFAPQLHLVRPGKTMNVHYTSKGNIARISPKGALEKFIEE